LLVVVLVVTLEFPLVEVVEVVEQVDCSLIIHQFLHH
jgi:hypothetical protein|tara:strand:- start:686 stop:796 length:111 start_codon:yes stop_codon:yes gene_type:complete